MAECGSGTKPDNSDLSVYFSPDESLEPEPTSSKNEEFLEKNIKNTHIEIIEVSSDDSDVEFVQYLHENLNGEKRSSTPNNQGLRLKSPKQSSFEESDLARSTENGEDVNIDFDRYLDSQNKSGSLVFNDTIDEMDMALKHGLDYKLPDDTGSKVSNNGNQLPVIKISKLETKKPQKTLKFHHVQSPVGDYIRNKSPKPANFQLPLKPARVTPNHLSPAVPTKELKRIVSPVGVYIKNTSEARLKQNVEVKTVSHLFKKAGKEPTDVELPQVMYQPPKKTFTTVKNEVTLPLNIKKLVKEHFIEKHEKKVCRDLKKTSLSRKLLEEDLTFNQTNEDVSFITKEQAFKE